jgi:cell shape-determining protein MreC
MKRYSSTTKANYRNNSPKTTRKWVGVALGTIVLGMIFPWLISQVSSIVLYPFHVTSTWLKTSDGVFPLYVRSKVELVAEIDALRQEIATDLGTQQSVKRLLEENMQLRALVNAGGEDERLVARVLARPNQLSYDVLQVDKGSRDGVVEGAPVYSGIDSVIGVVVHVAPTYSFVDLFTSPGFESKAFIFGPNVYSPIEGQGGGIARVKLPQGVPISVGQLVILPGVSSGVYGEIVSVENEPTQPEQYGYIAPSLSLNNLLYVSVGKESILVKTDEEIDETVRNFVRESLRLQNKTEYVPEVTEEVATTSEEGVGE